MNDLKKFSAYVVGFLVGYIVIQFIIGLFTVPDMTDFKNNFIRECRSNGSSSYSCLCSYNALLEKWGAKRLLTEDAEYRRTGITPAGFNAIVTNCF